jgi:two-component system, LuxR family, response regulator FixJ
MRGANIFIVDDDEAIRDSLQVLLEGKGHSVATYPSAEAFLTVCRPGLVGCAIVDVRMPGMDGLALIDRMRGQNIALPVIVVTGHADVPLAVRAMKAGASEFVEKPYATDTILEAIRRTLEAAGGGERFNDIVPAEVIAKTADLTPREREVLDCLVVGSPNKIIAHQLGISSRTVEIHRANLMKKMRADSLSHLVRMALAAGIGPKSAS